MTIAREVIPVPHDDGSGAFAVFFRLVSSLFEKLATGGNQDWIATNAAHLKVGAERERAEYLSTWTV
jgi:hypothetical protein